MELVSRLFTAIKFKKPLYTVSKGGILMNTLCPKCKRVGRLWNGKITECLFCGYTADTKEFYLISKDNK